MAHNDIVFSGIQPTGDLHIGNYFGALKQWIALQHEYRCYFCVVDLHALTVPQDPSLFARTTFDLAVDLLALGVDPGKSVLFIQSQVPEHAELMWLLNTCTPVGELERMTQYKEKAREHAANINAGLLTYPVLMAADILLYHGSLVPVGDDQVQHVELARVIARKFNRTYGTTFPEPKTKLTKGARIMSLTDPAKKMSKTHGEQSYIALADEPSVIERKIAKAVTATRGGSAVDPGVNNLFTILREIGKPGDVAKFEKAQQDGSIRYADLKRFLANALAGQFDDFRKRRKELLQNADQVREILERGRIEASIAAHATMQNIREKMGLLQPTIAARD